MYKILAPPEIRGQVFNVIPIPPKTGGMGMKWSFVTLNFQIVT